MKKSKRSNLLKSKTFWMGLSGVAIAAASAFGGDIPPELQRDVLGLVAELIQVFTTP